jgi:hypothetical protein
MRVRTHYPTQCAEISARARQEHYPRRGAVIVALVQVVQVSIFAVFHTRLHEPVAAARQRAVGEACVGVILIPVVARLLAIPHEPVAAARQRAVAQAIVGIILIPVVARFHPRPHLPVAAARGLAADQAIVSFIRIPIVARFIPLHRSVPALTRELAVLRTRFIVDLIPVIAILIGRMHERVATCSYLTRIGASVFVHQVAVVARLARLDYSVAAPHQLHTICGARCSRLVRGHVLAIAHFIRRLNTITASRLNLAFFSALAWFGGRRINVCWSGVALFAGFLIDPQVPTAGLDLT